MNNVNDKYFEAIVMRASYGGIQATASILNGLDYNYPLPIIIVIHRAKNIKKNTINLLQSHCTIPIKEADEKELIKEGAVYLAPANYHLLIEDDKTFSLSMADYVNFSRPSIDLLFETAAEVYREKLIGIVLSGASSDGSLGLTKIHEYGGITIVQDPATAESDIMPKAAIAASPINYILSLEQIKTFLISLYKHDFERK